MIGQLLFIDSCFFRGFISITVKWDFLPIPQKYCCRFDFGFDYIPCAFFISVNTFPPSPSFPAINALESTAKSQDFIRVSLISVVDCDFVSFRIVCIFAECTVNAIELATIAVAMAIGGGGWSMVVVVAMAEETTIIHKEKKSNYVCCDVNR